MHGHSQGFLRLLLADTIKVKLPLDLRWFWHDKLRLFFVRLNLQFAVENVLAKNDAVIADVNARPGDELAHFRVRLAAETAHREVGGAGHGNYMTTELFSTPGISFRD